ncbi:MAG: class I SAM-dependent methyltransferase [Nitrososphaerales archaeon]|jgi:SAM-dependent methyltransferase
MRNPWLDIPLDDYERHMSLPEIGQAQMIAYDFKSLLEVYSPSSVAVIGCAGGNGFDCIDSLRTTRIVGIDVNPDYIRCARSRFSKRFPILELYAQNIETAEKLFKPVQMIYAALVFEYIEFSLGLARMVEHLRAGGILAAILQLPSSQRIVSPSPFRSLKPLEQFMVLRSPEDFEASAKTIGLTKLSSKKLTLESGKEFEALVFRKPLKK